VLRNPASSGVTGSYTLTSVLNPTITNFCAPTMVTTNITATQQMSSTCIAQHDPSSSIGGREASIRDYYIFQPTAMTIRVRMTGGSIGDPYLEAKDLNGTLLSFN